MTLVDWEDVDVGNDHGRIELLVSANTNPDQRLKVKAVFCPKRFLGILIYYHTYRLSKQ